MEKTTDFSNPDRVWGELFDCDQWVKDKFRENHADQITTLAANLAKSFEALPALNAVANARMDKQSALVAAFVFCAIDDILISSKLLLAGKMMASGNLMRSAIEAIAMALLCSCNDLVQVQKARGKGIQQIRYWKMVDDQSKLVHGHLAVAQLKLNENLLGLAGDAVSSLRDAGRHYNQHSHAGGLGIAARFSLGKPGTVYAGGHYDPEKREGYSVELNERIGLCSTLPGLIVNLTQRIIAAQPAGSANG